MSGDYVAFERAGLRLAVAAERWIEAAVSAGLTRLPFAPPHLEGVARVGGRILPQIDVAGYPGLGRSKEAAGSAEGASLLVVKGARGALALRVERILGPIAGEAVTVLENLNPGGDGPPIVARFLFEGCVYRVIDSDGIVIAEAGFAPGIVTPSSAEARFARAPAEEGAMFGSTHQRLLIVEAAGRGLALEMEGLSLAFALGDIHPLPQAPVGVLGRTRARGRPVLVVDPFWPNGQAPTPGFAVVFTTPIGLVALRVDKVLGVARRPDPRWPGAKVEHRGRGLEVANGGELLADWLKVLGRLAAVSEGLSERVEGPAPNVWRRFLVVLVGSRRWALEFERVQRVVAFHGGPRLPGQTPAFDGVTDVDGAILPILDLRRALGAGAIGEVAAPKAGVAILVGVGGGLVAVIADAVQRIRKISSQDIHPLSDPVTAAVIALDGQRLPVLRPEGLIAPSPPIFAPGQSREGIWD